MSQSKASISTGYDKWRENFESKDISPIETYLYNGIFLFIHVISLYYARNQLDKHT